MKLNKDQEREVLAAYERLKSARAVVAELGYISSTGVYNVLERNGVLPARNRPEARRTGRLPEDVIAFLRMVEWHLEGLVDAKVIERQLDTLKQRHDLTV